MDLTIFGALVVASVGIPAVIDVVERGLGRAGASKKALALGMRIPEAQLSRQLRGERNEHFSMNRLMQSDRAIVREIALALYEWAGGERPVTAREIREALNEVRAARPVALHTSSHSLSDSRRIACL